MRIRTGRRTATLSATAALVLVGTSGCVPIAIGGALADDDSAFDLEVGDCSKEYVEGLVNDVDRVSCEDPHHGEVYANFDLLDGNSGYPGLDAVVGAAEAGCVQRFESFVGLDYSDSIFEIEFLYPSDTSWTRRNDRTITCIVFDPAGPTTGTLRNALL